MTLCLETIFKDNVDRQIFLKTLGETCQSAGWAVHSFVLMGNHYHLLIETMRSTLVKGMQFLNSTYTRRFNVRHKTSGHLFQGRYKALLVDSDNPGYFLTVSDYIHLNPVRAGIICEIKDLLKDPWSSAGWLTGMRKGRPQWVRWERVYGELEIKKWASRERREYRGYLKRRLQETLQDGYRQDQERWKNLRRGWCLGSEDFVVKMKGMLEEMAERPRQNDSWSGEAVEALEATLAEAALVKGCRRLGCNDPKRVVGMDRYLLAYWVRRQTKVGVKWLAQQMGMKSAGTLSHGIWKVGQRLQEDTRCRKRWKLLNR
jgi:REP element-mobilizing transposase RayT